MIHTVKGLEVINKGEVDVFLNSLSFSMIQWMVAIWSLVRQLFLNLVWTSGSSWFMYCWNLAWRILSITWLACEMNAIVWCLNILGVSFLWDSTVIKSFLKFYCQASYCRIGKWMEVSIQKPPTGAKLVHLPRIFVISYLPIQNNFFLLFL